MNELIKYYKSQYFNMIQILKDDGEEIEIGNWIKLNYSGGSKNIVSREGYFNSQRFKLIWLKWYNFDEGMKLLNESYDYIFFKNGDLYKKLIISLDGINNGNSKVWSNKFYNDIIIEISKLKYSGCLLIDEDDLNKLYNFKIYKNRNSKKYDYVINDLTFYNEFPMVDIDTNKPIVNKIKELDNINKFKNDRNELLNNLDEWYNISSKWVNKINR